MAGKEIKILMIGNSFSEDVSFYAPKIAKEMGISLKVVNMYIPGCSLDIHLDMAKGNKKRYDMQIYENDRWIHHLDTSLEEGIINEEYDYISFQQASPISGIPSSYDALEELMDYVKDKAINKNVSFIFNMTWSYPSFSKHPAFIYYKNDEKIMYKAILKAIKERIINNKDIKAIIPIGSAIENAKIYFKDNKLYRDDLHLSSFGRYIASLTLIKTLFNIDSSIAIKEEGYSLKDLGNIKICVNKAISNPLNE